MGSGEKKNNKKSDKKKSAAAGDGGRVQAEQQQRTMITDERFASAQSDPRFMEAPKKRSKVEIDSRFNRLFTDRSFASSKAPTDKRGKPNNKKDKAASSLSHYYRLQQEEEKGKRRRLEEEDEDDDSGASIAESLSKSDDESQSFDESLSTDTTDSESGYSEEEDDEEEKEEVPEIDKETRRLAAVNLDWTQVRAVDIYVLLSSFLPKGGQVMSVSVYPTEFGLKRMEEEAVHGPIGLFDDEKEKGDGDEDDDYDEMDNKKIRAYELSRLRYYFAVVVCDSITTADYLYKTCDGVEFERSANTLDLRFIPDSMEFKQQPRDVATEAPTDYEGLDFQTRALRHSNVHISWDEDEPHRSKTLKRILKSDQPADSELNAFLASDESDTDDDEDSDGAENRSQKKRKRQDKYLALIQSGDGSDEDVDEDNNQDMEVTFNSGLEDISKRIMEKKDKKSETVWEATLRKSREKKKIRRNRSKNSSDDDSDDSDRELGEQPDDFFVEEPSDSQVHSTKAEERDKEADASRAELELLLADVKGADSNLKGFNLKPKKRKGKKGKENPDEKLPIADYSDPRFSALLTNPLFALDPTDPQFKRSADYARQVAQKEKGGEAPELREGETVKKETLAHRKENHELSSLVRSIKIKSKQVPSQPERKVKWNQTHKGNIQK